MPDSLSVHSAAVSSDGERVSFVIALNGATKPTYVSRSALVCLDGVNGNDLLEIFRIHETEIAEAARLHLINKPSHIVVVLGSSDF